MRLAEIIVDVLSVKVDWYDEACANTMNVASMQATLITILRFVMNIKSSANVDH